MNNQLPKSKTAESFVDKDGYTYRIKVTLDIKNEPRPWRVEIDRKTMSASFPDAWISVHRRAERVGLDADVMLLKTKILNPSLSTLEAAITNNLPDLMKDIEEAKKKQVLVDFEFLHVENFVNRERLPVVILIESFFFGLITIRKRFFVHRADELLFLSRTDTGALSFYGVFEAAKAADQALKLYETGSAHKNFVLNF